jgi:hypothetical protein
MQKNIVELPIKQLTSEHLGALKATFDKISYEYCLKLITINISAFIIIYEILFLKSDPVINIRFFQ